MSESMIQPVIEPVVESTRHFQAQLSTLAGYCGGEVFGADEQIGHRYLQVVCTAEQPLVDGLAYVGKQRLLTALVDFPETAVIIKPEWREQLSDAHCGILHDNPQQAFRLILSALFPPPPPSGIAKTAVIADSALVASSVSVGHHCVIAEATQVAENCRIGANSVVEAGCFIGEGTVIGHNVTICANTQIGQGCVIDAGAVIGRQGFGFSFEGGHWAHIPQIGRVILGNDVHVGANSCIDRGAINDTVIGNNVIIDNLVQIGHNVCVGDGTAMASGVGISGSTTIGKHCLLAGKVGMAGHLTIADGVQINGGSRVMKSISEPGTYAGSFPIQPVQQWNRNLVYFKKLATLFKKKNDDK